MYLLKPYTSILPISGYSRSLILDQQRDIFHFVPNGFITVLEKLKTHFPDELLNNMSDTDSVDTLKSYLDFMIAQEFVFPCEKGEIDCFPDIGLAWDFPAKIICCEIELNDWNVVKKSFSLLKSIKLYSLKLIVKNQNCIKDIDFSDDFFDSVRDIKIVFRDISSVPKGILKSVYQNPRVNHIITNEKPDLEEQVLVDMKSIERELLQPQSISDFYINIELISESQQHHTYFNRKLYIGPNGEIKNAPECKDEFGYIQDIDHINDLKRIIERKEFQKFWFVNKDKCDVCKHCEFRYMCVDNRIPYQRTDEEWYHKEACNYNPFICKWKHEEGYLSLEDSGVISSSTECSIDHETIQGINSVLWQ